jgi:hypothetical protein
VRSRRIVTGVAILGLAANAAPALANQGGLPVEPANPGGGVSAEGPEFAPTPGGIPAGAASSPVDPNSMTAKIRYIERHMRDESLFQSFTLDSGAEPARRKTDFIHAKVISGPHKGDRILNPVALFSEDGTRIARYAAPVGETSLLAVAASQVRLTEFIGGTALPVENPLDFATPHTLRLNSDPIRGVVGFKAENGENFAALP